MVSYGVVKRLYRGQHRAAGLREGKVEPTPSVPDACVLLPVATIHHDVIAELRHAEIVKRGGRYVDVVSDPQAADLHPVRHLAGESKLPVAVAYRRHKLQHGVGVIGKRLRR